MEQGTYGRVIGKFEGAEKVFAEAVIPRARATHVVLRSHAEREREIRPFPFSQQVTLRGCAGDHVPRARS